MYLGVSIPLRAQMDMRASIDLDRIMIRGLLMLTPSLMNEDPMEAALYIEENC